MEGFFTFELAQFSKLTSDSEPSVGPTLIRVGNTIFNWMVPAGLAVRRGHHYRGYLQLSPPRARLNPTLWGSFRTQVEKRPGFAQSVGPIALVHVGRGLDTWLDTHRHKVAHRIRTQLGGNVRQVVLALGMGHRESMSDAMRQRFNEMGISHLLAISGLHMSLLGALLLGMGRFACWLLFFGRPSRLSRQGALVFTLLGLWCFCCWVGAPISAVRATLMATAFLVALVCNESQIGMNGLGLAMTIMVLCDPGCLFQVGYWLSVGCTFFLLLWTSRQRRGVARKFVSWVGMSVVAWLATLPLLALCFGEVYLWSVPANLGAVPLGAWVVAPLSMAACVVCGLGLPIPQLLEFGLGVGVHAIEAWIGILSRLPYTRTQVTWEVSTILCGTLWPGLLVVLGSHRRWKRVFFGGAALFLAAWIFHSPFVKDPGFRVHMPYVGHGDAILVELPRGATMLIDGGGAAYGSRFEPGEHAIAPLIRKIGITHLDYVVASHPDHDHIGGLTYLLKRFTVGEFWVDALYADHPKMKPLVDLVLQGGGQVIHVQSLPDRFSLRGSEVELFYPRVRHAMDSRVAPNQRSLVFQIRVGPRSVLFSGDLESSMETLLAPHLPSTELLKVPHHGSRTSSSETFLAAVNPCLAMVSSGNGRRGAFPHESVVKRFETRSIPLFRTHQLGALTLRATQRGWNINSHRGESRNIECQRAALTPRGRQR